MALADINSQKHPRGLYFLFFTEMWERFSFYGISGILVLYVTKQLHLPDGEAGLLSGAYMAFTFLAPILGGWVADKFIGYVVSVTIGAILIFAGNVILAIPSFDIQGVYAGLAVVAIGTGFLKSTVSVLLGQLYDKKDVKRDAAYTIFYMGINLGSILAGLIIAYVAENINWHYGFALAAMGMLLGLIIFLIGFKKHNYSDISNIVRHENLKQRLAGIPCSILLVLGTIAAIFIMYTLLSDPGKTKIVITFISFGLLIYIAILGVKAKTSVERNQLFSILVFIITAIFFWSLYKQSFNSLALFIDRDTDKVFMGHAIPTSMFVLVPNSLFLVALAGLFANFWIKMEQKGKQISAPAKFLIGLIFTIGSFATFAFGAYLAYASGNQSSMFWPLLGILLLTCAELCISPVGLSIVSKMSPTHLSGFLMGAWFLASSIGSYVSGLLSSFVSIPEGTVDVKVTANAYFGLFSNCTIGMLVVAIIFAILLPKIKRLTSDK